MRYLFLLLLASCVHPIKDVPETQRPVIYDYLCFSYGLDLDSPPEGIICSNVMMKDCLAEQEKYRQKYFIIEECN